MALPLILLAIGSLISGIWEGIKGVAVATYNVLKEVFDWFKQGMSWFLQTAPTGVKLLFFLFFTLYIANVFVGTYLHLNFYCDSDNNLYQPKNAYDSVKMFFTTSFSNIENNTLLYDEYIANNTIPAEQYGSNKAESIVQPKCLNQVPRWLLFGKIDFLNYRMWVVILLIGMLLSIMDYLKVWTQATHS